jgi:hypothetical protein
MVPAVESPRALSLPRRRARPRRDGLRVVVRPRAEVITRERLLASWTSALDSVDAAAESAYELRAIDAAALRKSRRRVQAEREWVALRLTD